MPGIIAVLLLSAAIAGCALQPVVSEDIPRSPSYSIVDWQATSLGGQAEALAREHLPRSGFAVLEHGEDALLWRGALTDRAERAIDAQYFIWTQDNVGTIAAERLLRAAERGVRVRVLVDDIPLATDPRFLAMLDAHPLIEIRVYNPTGVVGRQFFPKALAIAGDFYRLNRRMHNKALIVDGAFAVIGGRNIADEYYDMHREYNFRDRDLLCVGPVVGEIAGAFDRYWNSVWAVPVAALVRVDPTDEERADYYAALHAYVADEGHFPPRFHEALTQTHVQMANLARELVWGPARLIYDVPGKNDDIARLDAFGAMGQLLTDTALAAQREIVAETPYLAMMPGTFRVMGALRERGVRVRILTNGLASTDNIVAFSRYAGERAALLRLGVELHELMPFPQHHGEIVRRLARMQGSTRLALHAKTMVIDRRTVFVGTFNMDPRSTHLNTEMGVLVDSPELATKVVAAIERDMAPENSWAVTLDPSDGAALWSWRSDGLTTSVRHEPEASLGRLLQVLLFSLLPIGSLI
jgi:putative cardiolipin synthase